MSNASVVLNLLTELSALARTGRLHDAAVAALGINRDDARLNELAVQFSAELFSGVPRISFVKDEILGMALGAYSQVRKTIYIRNSLKNSNDEQLIKKVLYEELGHHLDATLNLVDTQGDEGEVFARIMLGAQADVANSTTNDSGYIYVDGELLDVEFSAVDDIFSTNKGVPISGNLFSDNGNGPDSANLTVTSINGSSLPLNGSIILSSGAILTVLPNGSFTYDGGLFDSELLPNSVIVDSFVYQATDGISTFSANAMVMIMNPIATTFGTKFNDAITGTSADDAISSLEGDDVLQGLAGSDILEAGIGNDTLDGGSERDMLVGDPQIILTNKTFLNSGPNLNGETIEVGLSIPAFVPSSGSVLTGLVSLGSSSVVDNEIVYVIDVSGSTSATFSGNEAVLDQNGNGRSSEVIDAEIASFLALTQSLVDAGLASAKLSIVPFASGANIGFSGTVGQDINGNGVRDADEFIRTLRAGGATSFASGLNQTINAFTPDQGGQKNVYFISDGFNNGPSFTSQVATLINPTGLNASIRAIGVGAGASLSQLDLVDDGLANNTAERVLTPSALTAGLVSSSLALADVNRVDILVNGVLVDTVVQTQLVETPFGIQFKSAILPISQQTEYTARAVLTDGSIVDVIGSTDPARFSDSLTGGAGNDMLEGGIGIDYAFFSGPRSEYNIVSDPITRVSTVEQQLGTQLDGLDTLSNVEFAVFADGAIIPLPVVNEAPVLTLPTATIEAEAGLRKAIAGISVNDVDTPVLSVLLEPTNGGLVLSASGGVTQISRPNGGLLLEGTSSDITNALASLSFIGAQPGAGSILITADDGNTVVSGSLAINVVQAVEVGSPPVNTVPAPVEVGAGQALGISGLSVSDPDSASLTVLLAPKGGSITAVASEGASVVLRALGALEVSGGIGAVNATLATLNYVAGSFTADGSVSIVTSDGVLEDADTLVISIVFNKEYAGDFDWTLTGSPALGRVVGGNVVDETFTNVPKVTITGGLSANSLNASGWSGESELVGLQGGDLLIGGSGFDTSTGGAGADRFRIAVANADSSVVDVLTDFNRSEGDIIEVSKTAFNILPPAFGSRRITNALRRIVLGLSPATIQTVTASAGVDQALRSNNLFVYDNSTGDLWLNQNWSQPGAGTAGVIARLANAPASLASGSITLI